MLMEPLRYHRNKLHRWVGWFVINLAMLLGMTGCSISDDRDICCEEVVLLYRYVRTTFDEYRFFIQNKRHFLFDDQGLFIREVYSTKKEPQRLSLVKLPTGAYTVVTVGNVTEGYTRLTSLKPGVSRLQDFQLTLEKHVAEGVLAEAEELFWNSRTFTVEEGKRYSYICDMANIHCHLYMKVQWEALPPPGSPLYHVELSYLAPGYSLQIDDSYSIAVAGTPPAGKRYSTPSFVWHEFPHFLPPDSAIIRVEEPLQGQDLYPKLITLRYRDDAIPTLQIRHQGEPLFKKPIDLKPIFLDWGWLPNKSHEQIYRIELYIKKDGNVIVKPWFSGSVEDWQDGGTFG